MPRDYGDDEAREPRVPEATADLVLMSPDGDRALVQANNQVYVVTVPQVGGAPPTVMETARRSTGPSETPW